MNSTRSPSRTWSITSRLPQNRSIVDRGSGWGRFGGRRAGQGVGCGNDVLAQARPAQPLPRSRLQQLQLRIVIRRAEVLDLPATRGGRSTRPTRQSCPRPSSPSDIRHQAHPTPALVHTFTRQHQRNSRSANRSPCAPPNVSQVRLNNKQRVGGRHDRVIGAGLLSQVIESAAGASHAGQCPHHPSVRGYHLPRARRDR